MNTVANPTTTDVYGNHESRRTESILVVGIDSFVGSELCTRLRASGNAVIGTTKRRASVNDSQLFLDLGESPENWCSPGQIRVAFVCAGVTNFSDCRRDPEGSTRINVHGVFALAKNLVASGVRVIYLSTNAVFDGSLPCRQPDAPRNPLTEYGRQKSEAELRLLELGDLVSVVRFSKILGPDVPLFKGWINNLRVNKPVHPYNDMVMSPVPLDFTITVLEAMSRTDTQGILQVSGQQDLSYMEAAYLGASLFELDKNLIEPIATPKEGSHPEKLPKHTTMNLNQLRSKLKLDPPDVRWTLEKSFRGSCGDT